MGGKALSKTETRRYQAAEYHEFTQRLLTKLKERFPNDDLAVVEAYRNKPDFGDLDLVLRNREGLKPELSSLLVELGVVEVVKNGPCWSTGFGDFQVDFLFHRDFEFAKSYFAWNDLGNLVGRVAKAHGFKFGHDGLWYVLKHRNYVVKSLCVTTDFSEALEFLGFDSTRFNQGFDDLTDVFEFVTSSKHYNKDFFLFANRSNKDRVRDRKRKSYNLFLDWIDTNESGFAVLERVDLLASAKSVFPEFAKQLENAKDKYALQQEVKRKFNGQVVSTLTDLSGKELGKFMAELRKSKENVNAYVLQASNEEVANWVSSEFLSFSVK